MMMMIIIIIVNVKSTELFCCNSDISNIDPNAMLSLNKCSHCFSIKLF